STGPFSFFGVGGTSASAPSFAGIIALIGQSEATAGRSRRQGNANQVLYKLAQTAANSCNSSTQPLAPPATCVFYNITKGNNSVPCAANSPAGTSPNCSSTTAGTNGVLVTVSGATKTPAFTATAGSGSIPSYNLATGLGSVNIANLATAWGTAAGSFKATTSTLKINGSTTPGTIAHGTAVTAAVTVAVVSPATGTPTGDVSVVAPSGTINGGNNGTGTLSGGAATINGVILPGGSYNVAAHYPGDGTFSPSDSAGVPITVNKENSRLQYSIVTFDPNTGNILSTSATSFTYGSPYILRFDILNSSANACAPLSATPVTTGCALDARGTVTITDNGNPLDQGTFPVNTEGSGEDQPIQLTGGVHNLSATYSGDNSYNPVTTAVTDTVTVSKATTTTATVPSVSTVASGTPMTLTATISSSSNSAVGATGTVTFTDGTTQIGSPVTVVPVPASTVGAGGTAALTWTFSTTGSHSITAAYSGDTNYSTSTATAINVTVTTSGSFTVSGAAVTVTAGSSGMSAITVTPSGGFTGIVNVTCGSIPGVTCTPNPLAINIVSATAVASNLTVAVAAPSSSTTASIAPLDRTVYAAILAAPGGGNGWWTLSGMTGLAALLLLALPGKKRYRMALALGLVCVLSFSLGCGGGYGGGGGGGGGPTATTTHLTVSSTKLPNTAPSITVSATVTGGTPAGNVQFFVDGAALGGTAPVSGGTTGNITVTAAQAPAFLQLVGTHTVSAHYLGDAYTAASQSGTLNVTITGTTNLPITGTSGATNANANISLTIN
ncbi:MAG TPA: Ig-like domain repeat protein, partial [Candidatus Angelobacter sp.]|nr:Ig-like domain repeat protein [Candidatus Angelobacter sp.]